MMDFVTARSSQKKITLKAKSAAEFLKKSLNPDSLFYLVKEKPLMIIRNEMNVPRTFENKKVKDKYIEDYGNIIWRIDVWKQSIHFGLASPIYGQGFGRYPNYVFWGRKMATPKRLDVNSGVIPTHNHLVSIFYKMGVVGLSLFLWINISAFRVGLHYSQKSSSAFCKYFLIGVLGAVIFWHATALFFDIIDSPPTSIFLWILMGLIFSVAKISKGMPLK